jgi:hypothetical protein
MPGSRRKSAISPVIATIILIGIFVAVVSAALGFAFDELSSYYAQSDLQQSNSVSTQVAQGINSVALTFGRSVSVGYSFRYASVAVVPDVIQYVITVVSPNCPHSVCTIYAYTGMLMIAIPGHYFSLGNNYQAVIYPTGFVPSNTFVSKGGSGSMSVSFSKEFENPAGGGENLYTVVVPVPLEINTTQTLTSSAKPTPVIRLYVVQLSSVGQPYQLASNCTAKPPSATVSVFNLKSGYISVQGQGEQVCTIFNILKVQVSEYNNNTLYPPQFFGFAQVGQSISYNSPSNVTLQVFVGDVGIGGA